MSRFFCLWIPHFQASALIRADASLRDRALLVSYRDHVIDASLEALRCGVQIGWTVARAESSVGNAVVRPANPTEVSLAWEAVLSSLYRRTPLIESIRPGLLMAELKPRHVAEVLEEHDAFGGIADNRATAELAAYWSYHAASSRRDRQLPDGRNTAFLHSCPVDLLSEAGIPQPTLERLHWFGIDCIGKLAAFSRRQLVEQFNEGALLHRYASTEDCRPVMNYHPPQYLQARHVFEFPAEELNQWLPVLPLLLTEVCTGLENSQARTLRLSLDTSRGKREIGRTLREPARSPRVLLELVNRLAHEIAPAPHVRVEAVALTLGGLEKAPGLQYGLFEEDRRAVRCRSLQPVLHLLESRFPGTMGKMRLHPLFYLREEAYSFEPAVTGINESELGWTQVEERQRRRAGAR